MILFPIPVPFFFALWLKNGKIVQNFFFSIFEWAMQTELHVRQRCDKMENEMSEANNYAKRRKKSNMK